MNDSDSFDEIANLSSSLQILKSQWATFGSAYVPPHIVLQVSEIERQLAELVRQRSQQMFDARHLDAKPPSFARGLITAVSMLSANQRLEDLGSFQAINYYRSLQYCWLLATSSENQQASEPTAHTIKKYFQRYGIDCKIYVIKNGFDALDTHQVMNKILKEIEELGELLPNQLICDITSGTKAMTAGMVLACGDKVPMQYMLQYERGLPSLPVLLHVDN